MSWLGIALWYLLIPRDSTRPHNNECADGSLPMSKLCAKVSQVQLIGTSRPSCAKC